MGAPRTWEGAALDAIYTANLGQGLLGRALLQDIDDEVGTSTPRFGHMARMAYRCLVKHQGTADRTKDVFTHQLVRLLASKQHDYGHANINRFGIEGVKVRISDKVCRLKNLQGRGADASNEAIEDSWIDIIGYCVIALMIKAGTFDLPLEADLPKTKVKKLAWRYEGGKSIHFSLDAPLGLFQSLVRDYLAPDEGHALVASVSVRYTDGTEGTYSIVEVDA